MKAVERPWAFPILLAALVAGAIALLGASLTELGPWYAGLALPRWAPPAWLYAAGWMLVYATTAIAALSGWLRMPWREREMLIGLFALNAFLNILWSLLFLRLQRPDWAVFAALALWLSVGALIVFTWRRSMSGAALLVPYLLWVTYIGYLCMTIVKLNGPFG